MELKNESDLNTFYIHIPSFTITDYRDPNFIKKIYSILRSEDAPFLCFESLEALYTHKRHTRTDSLFPIECELDETLVQWNGDFFKIIKPSKILLGINCFMKAIYIDTQKISYHSNLMTQEDEHVQCIEQARVKQTRSYDEFLLKTEPTSYLSQITPFLRPLLFIDYKLFERYLEHARHYNKREAGSVADLFRGFKEVVIPQWGPLTQDFKLTLHHIQKLHATVTESLYASSKEKAGRIRTQHTSFQLTLESASVQGIFELLKRIKNEKNSCLAIGEYHSYRVFHKFLCEMEHYIHAHYHDDDFLNGKDETTKRMQFGTLKNIAIANLLEKQSIKEIAWDEVLTIIEQGLKTYEIILNSYYENDQDLSMQLYYFIPKIKYKDSYSQEELNINIQYLRKNGWNKDSLKNLCDDKLKALAKSLYADIENNTPIALFPPAPDELEMLIQLAIETFNHDIQKAHTFLEKLTVIDTFIHILEITHVFSDGNCRTAYLLLNELLTKVGIKWTVLFDPNRYDAYSQSERILEIMRGILRLEYIINHQESILIKYKQCEDRFLSKNSTKSQNPYSEKSFFSNNKTVDSYSEAEQLALCLFDMSLDKTHVNSNGL